MSPEHQQKLKSTLHVSIVSAILTAFFMYFIYYRCWQSIAAGLSIGFLIPLSLTWYTETIYKRYLIRTNLLIVLLINTLVHLVVIISIATLFVIVFYMQSDFGYIFSNPSMILSKFFLIGIGFGLILSLGFNFFSIINTLIGSHMLGKLFIGMYRHPKETERVFMFLDIKLSTTLAEQMGHLKFMSLVNDFFYDITQPVQSSKGEIYKYVGDEVIIAWKIRDALINANCIRCFVKIQQVIESKASYYKTNYGIVPQFKAGLHGGMVVTGEMGLTRREIAYMGDVLNTTSRIEGACKTYNEDLLISEYLVQQIGFNSDLQFIEVGSEKLRGKLTDVKLYRLER